MRVWEIEAVISDDNGCHDGQALRSEVRFLDRLRTHGFGQERPLGPRRRTSPDRLEAVIRR